ncbi:MAG: extracellular solute-binding protein [Spirochaetales bacterium]|nr:extracellular solute-binding protein [Spirochaetales bacterium]
MKKLTKAFIFTALIMLLFLVSACGPSGQMSGGPITLKLWHPFSEAENKKITEILARYEEKNPNIKLEILQIPFNELADKTNLAIDSGDTPDVLFGVHDGVGTYGTKDGIEPMRDYIDDFDTRYMASAIEAVKYKGVPMAAPITVECPVLIYNTDMVKNPPKTLDELLAIARENTKDDTYGFVMDITNYYFTYGFLTAFGGTVFKNNDLLLAKPSFNTQGTTAFLKFMGEIRNKYKIIPNEVDYNTMMALFTEGKAAFMINGPWCFGDLDGETSKVKGKWKIANYPDGTRTAQPFMGVKVIYIPKAAKHKKEAADCIKYLTSKDIMEEFNASIGWVPAISNAEISSDWKANGIMQQAKNAYPIPNIPAMGAIWDNGKEGLNRVIINEEDPLVVVKEIQVKMDDKLKEILNL